MSFRLQSIDGDKWELTFIGEPSYVHALKMAPESIESGLKTGLWLVVVFPVWSAPARDSVRAAVAFAKEWKGKFQLGVRPYDSHEEIHKWWPVATTPSPEKQKLTIEGRPPHQQILISIDSSSIPTWLVLRNGQAVEQSVGPMSRGQLADLMQEYLSRQ